MPIEPIRPSIRVQSRIADIEAKNTAAAPQRGPTRTGGADRPDVPERPATLRTGGETSAPRGAGLPLKSPNVDALMHSFVGRGIDVFKAEGAIATAAAALDDKKHVMLLTGFSVAPQMPETDGMATAVLGKALKEAGKLVTFVTDTTNRPILLAALKEVDAEMAAYSRVVEFNPAHGKPAEAQAKAVLDQLKPDAVIAIELPGRSADLHEDGTHVYRNMRGVDISPFNGPVDELLVQANKTKGVFTAGIGDGGNEAGVTHEGIPKALDGTNMANTVKSDVMITAWNSNIGAIGLGAAVAQRHGKLDKMPTPDTYVRSMEATLEAGAVDGVTRGRIPNEKIGENHTGVDGFHLESHAGDVRKLIPAIKRDIPAGVVHVEPGNPFIVAGTDSSDGGLIGGKNLIGFLQHRYHAPSVLVPVLDHGNAPYGDHTRENLVIHAGRMEQTALMVGDLTATICNTQATTLPASLHIPPFSPTDDKAAWRENRTVNLVDVTAQAIVDAGGPHPVLLSTQGTKDSGAYPKKIEEYSGGKVKPTMVACPEWAPLVNNRLHESDKPEDKAAVKAMVAPYVAAVKALYDEGKATSVNLCCTHYPALAPHIAAEMKELGIGHVPLVDPIESLAEAVMKRLDAISGEIDRSKRTVANDPIVLTTATDTSKVQASAEHILKNRNPGSETPNVTVLGLKSFGADISLQLLDPVLFPKAPPKAEADSASIAHRPMDSGRTADASASTTH